MKSKKYPSQAELKELFDYDPDTGVLTWKVKPKTNRVKIGDVAGTKCSKGYLQVRINGIKYLNHRIIWIMREGEIPNGYQIDHINQIKDNNCRTNLRLATSSQNNQNTNAQKNNKSGVKGLCEWVDRHGTKYWRVAVTINNDRKHKHFPFTESTKESQKAVAIAWLERTRAELHGEFANHGTSHNSCLKSPTP